MSTVYPGSADDNDSVCSDDRVYLSSGVVTLVTGVMQTFVSPHLSANHSSVLVRRSNKRQVTIADNEWVMMRRFHFAEAGIYFVSAAHDVDVCCMVSV